MGSAWPERVSQACLRATGSRRYRSCDRWRHQYDSTACPISPKRSWPKVSLTRSVGRSWARLGHRAQSGLANKRPSTSGREAKLQAAQASKRGWEIDQFEPMDVIPRAREAHQELVSRLEQVEDVSAAREAIRAIVGEIRLVPEGDELVAELTSAGLAGACQLTLVAGAGFEPATFGL